MHQTLRTLLSDLIDYAGLFPPAGLGMGNAVRKYDEYRKGPFSWMLGRFVVPAARLSEFEEAHAALPDNAGGVWRLSVLVGPEVDRDRQSIDGFRNRHLGSVTVDSIEAKAHRPEVITELPQRLPSEPTVYVEIPIAGEPTELIASMAAAGLNAKVRTGAVTADGFPMPAQLARFLALCATHKVPFKATAGLHHPLRKIYRLTYETDSDSALMHGFLNLFLSAAFARRGMTETFLVDLLEERSFEAFRFGSESIGFRGEVLTDSDLKKCRDLAISFGSCSFEEPVADLHKLGLL
jgi:hypothetical protein